MSEWPALVDGEARDQIEVTDASVLRGDGCFEAVRSYGGALFRLDDHLDRLERSAAALELRVPDRSLLRDWSSRVARGDCIVRIVLTRGAAVPGADAGERCVVLAHPIPESQPEVRLWPVRAPWHPAGRAWELSGVKTISYAPNLAAGRRARAEGADDALLVTEEGVVLEGPTFSVGWWKGERAFTPSLDLGILDSITRRVVKGLVPEIEEVAASLAELEAADEVFAMSTVKEVLPVVAVGAHGFASGSRTRDLAQRFAELVGQLSTESQPR